MKEILQDPIHEEVREKLNNLGIRAILFDLDDTLIYTQEIFDKYMEEYCEVVSESTGIPAEEVMEVLKEFNKDVYKRMGVNPARWAVVLEHLVVHFPDFEEVIRGNLDILMKIYTEVPRVREGARVTLEILKDLGIKVGLVTHANVDWTIFKLDAIGFWDYFDDVHIVDENGHKKKVDWSGAMVDIDEDPEHCLVIGDSMSGDIQPADELGARTLWVNGSTWDVYRQGQVPERTLPVRGVIEMFAALDQLR